MIGWLVVLGMGVLLLSSKGGGMKALPDPKPTTEWRGDEVEAAACEILREPPGGTMPSAAEIQWIIARAAYPEHSWPMQPGSDLPDGSAADKVALWQQLGQFAAKVSRFEIACPEGG